jgi:hypothetical protein
VRVLGLFLAAIVTAGLAVPDSVVRHRRRVGVDAVAARALSASLAAIMTPADASSLETVSCRQQCGKHPACTKACKRERRQCRRSCHRTLRTCLSTCPHKMSGKSCRASCRATAADCGVQTGCGAPTTSPTSTSTTTTLSGPLSQAEAQAILDDQDQALQIAQTELAMLGDTYDARLAAAASIRNLGTVADAGISPDRHTILITYKAGGQGRVLLSPPGSKGGASSPTTPTPRATSALEGRAITLDAACQVVSQVPTEPGPPRRALLWDPFPEQFPGELNIAEDAFARSLCDIDVTYLSATQCDVDSVASFPQYDIVVMSTHGYWGDDLTTGEFLTREPVVDLWHSPHLSDWLEKRLTFGNAPDLPDQRLFWSVESGFIRTLRFLPHVAFGYDSVVLNSSCLSSLMGPTFVSAGVGLYFGYDNFVSAEFTKRVAQQFWDAQFPQMSPANIGDVLLTNMVAAYDRVDPKVDTTPESDPPANFVFAAYPSGLQSVPVFFFTGSLQGCGPLTHLDCGPQGQCEDVFGEVGGICIPATLGAVLVGTPCDTSGQCVWAAH